MTTLPRSPAGHELGTHEPTAETRWWIRRCNHAEPGTLVGLLDATWQAQQDDVVGTLATGLSWTALGPQGPGEGERTFTLEPVTEAEAREWIRANHRVTTA